MRYKVCIIGGCVSRDVFVPEFDRDAVVNVEAYFARYSIARMGEGELEELPDLSKISSVFQRRMVEQDLTNGLLEWLAGKELDLVLIDFLSMKYAMVKYHGVFVTESREFKQAQVIDEATNLLSRINVNNPEYWEKWENGFRKLTTQLENFGHLDKVLINRVYFARENSKEGSSSKDTGFFGDVKSLLSWSQNSKPSLSSGDRAIDEQNKLLDRMYAIAEKYIPKEQFLNYPNSLFRRDVNHKWGPAAMHYYKNFYEYSFKLILSILDKK